MDGAPAIFKKTNDELVADRQNLQAGTRALHRVLEQLLRQRLAVEIHLYSCSFRIVTCDFIMSN